MKTNVVSVSSVAVIAATLLGGCAVGAGEPKSKLRATREPAESKAKSSGVNILDNESFELPPKSSDFAQIICSRALQKEIELSDRQAAKINAMLRARLQEGILANLAIRNAQTPEARAEADQRAQSMAEETDQAFATILNKAQFRRLNEISVQNAGIRAYLLPRVIDALGLDEDQVLEIQLIMRQLGEEDVEMRTTFFRDSPKDPIPSQDRVRIEEANKQRKAFAVMRAGVDTRAEQAIQRVLTPAQKKVFRRLKGTRFDVSVYRGTDAEVPNPKGTPVPIPLYPDSD